MLRIAMSQLTVPLAPGRANGWAPLGPNVDWQQLMETLFVASVFSNGLTLSNFGSRARGKADFVGSRADPEFKLGRTRGETLKRALRL